MVPCVQSILVPAWPRFAHFTIVWPCSSNLAAAADIQPTSVARCVSYVAGWERAEVREEEGVEILKVIYHSVPLYVWAMHLTCGLMSILNVQVAET